MAALVWFMSSQAFCMLCESPVTSALFTTTSRLISTSCDIVARLILTDSKAASTGERSGRKVSRMACCSEVRDARPLCRACSIDLDSFEETKSFLEARQIDDRAPKWAKGLEMRP